VNDLIASMNLLLACSQNTS